MVKPKHLSQEYGDQFQDLSIAERYRKRPPYHSEVFDILSSLIENDSGSILDVGCGTGEIAIPMAARGYVVDAVDPSQAMLDIAKKDPSTVSWYCSYTEKFEFPTNYDLICCANSLHWMDWQVVFPMFSKALSDNSHLAIVTDGGIEGVPNYDEIVEVIGRFSTNQDFKPFSLLNTIQAEGYIEFVDSASTKKIPTSQPLSDYIDSFHARNGLSVERMGIQNAEMFDNEIRKILEPDLVGGKVCGYTKVTVSWGIPA
jgi:SAM-dependent methyltransferase